MKKYKTGFYGGKFIPFHKGHYFCIETAARECEKLFVILFVNSVEEENILKEYKDYFLSQEYRCSAIKNACNKFQNVFVCSLDIGKLRDDQGEEDWQAEVPLIIEITGKFDVIYSSEISYDNFFRENYPWAEHRIIDAERKNIPISATKIRQMKNDKEKQQWII
ncbi:MAG: adenylyltransferase/cytidyltransferase family protein [Cardiobacteriaceae bacterium]|nr:adenylyltransferase/cytidyltransferase family protein [Cardiobacteriaceae bacterium]